MLLEFLNHVHHITTNNNTYNKKYATGNEVLPHKTIVIGLCITLGLLYSLVSIAPLPCSLAMKQGFYYCLLYKKQCYQQR